MCVFGPNEDRLISVATNVGLWRSTIRRAQSGVETRGARECLAVFKGAFSARLLSFMLRVIAQADCCSVGVDTELWLKMLSPD